MVVPVYHASWPCLVYRAILSTLCLRLRLRLGTMCLPEGFSCFRILMFRLIAQHGEQAPLAWSVCSGLQCAPARHLGKPRRSHGVDTGASAPSDPRPPVAPGRHAQRAHFPTADSAGVEPRAAHRRARGGTFSRRGDGYSGPATSSDTLRCAHHRRKRCSGAFVAFVPPASQRRRVPAAGP